MRFDELAGQRKGSTEIGESMGPALSRREYSCVVGMST